MVCYILICYVYCIYGKGRCGSGSGTGIRWLRKRAQEIALEEALETEPRRYRQKTCSIEHGKRVRHLVLGDIHGMYRRMMRSLPAAHFCEHDTLIFLGDLADGRESREVLDFVSTLRSRILILGNHEYALRTIASGVSAMVEEWLDTYRGHATCWSYGVDPALITVTKHETPQIRFDNEVVSGRELLQRIFPPRHLALLDEMIPSVIMKDLCPGHDALLCHAGLMAGVAVRDHEDWMFAYGDPEWIPPPDRARPGVRCGGHVGGGAAHLDRRRHRLPD